MAGDDLMLPGKIQKQVDYYGRIPSVHFVTTLWKCSIRILITHCFILMQKKWEQLKKLSKVVTFFGSCSVVLRTKDIPQKGYDNRIPIASDWLICIDTLANGGTVEYIDEVLGRYRRHSGNITKIRKDYNNEIDLLNTCNTSHVELSTICKRGLYCKLFNKSFHYCNLLFFVNYF